MKYKTKYKTSGKLKESMIAKYGSEEAWKAHMRAIASKGGQAPIGAFSVVPGLAKRAGKRRHGKD